MVATGTPPHHRQSSGDTATCAARVTDSGPATPPGSGRCRASGRARTTMPADGRHRQLEAGDADQHRVDQDHGGDGQAEDAQARRRPAERPRRHRDHRHGGGPQHRRLEPRHGREQQQQRHRRRPSRRGRRAAAATARPPPARRRRSRPDTTSRWVSPTPAKSAASTGDSPRSSPSTKPPIERAPLGRQRIAAALEQPAARRWPRATSGPPSPAACTSVAATSPTTWRRAATSSPVGRGDTWPDHTHRLPRRPLVAARRRRRPGPRSRSGDRRPATSATTAPATSSGSVTNVAVARNGPARTGRSPCHARAPRKAATTATATSRVSVRRVASGQRTRPTSASHHGTGGDHQAADRGDAGHRHRPEVAERPPSTRRPAQRWTCGRICASLAGPMPVTSARSSIDRKGPCWAR